MRMLEAARSVIASFALLSLSILLSGCAGSTSTEDLADDPIGTERVVERSAAERPDWITNPPDEEDGMKFFSGGEEGFEDYAMGLRMARAEAWQDLAESVMATWNSLLQASEVSDANSMDSYARNFQELAVSEVRVTGVEAEEEYYEKVARRTAYGVENAYNAFVLLTIPSVEWRAAQERALEQLRQNAEESGDTRAEDFIQDAIDRLDELSG